MNPTPSYICKHRSNLLLVVFLVLAFCLAVLALPDLSYADDATGETVASKAIDSGTNATEASASEAKASEPAASETTASETSTSATSASKQDSPVLTPQQITTPLIFDDSTASTSGAGYSWDASTKTLTLNGIDISVSTDSAIVVPDNATIVFSGNNRVATSAASPSASDRYCAINGGDTLTIRGASGATLTAIATGEGDFGIGSNVSLTLSGGTYDVTAAEGTLEGIYAEGLGSASVIIEDAVVTATGFDHGILVFGDTDPSSITNSTITVSSISAQLQSSVCEDIFCIGAMTMTNSKLYPKHNGAGFTSTLDMTGSTIELSLAAEAGLSVSNKLTLDSSTIDVTAGFRPLNIGSGGMYLTNSTVTATATSGFIGSCVRTSGDVVIDSSTLTCTANGTKMTGLKFISSTPNGPTGVLKVNSGRVEAVGSSAGIAFQAGIGDPSTKHLVLGKGEQVLEGGTFCYSEGAITGGTVSDWSFSTSGTISHDESGILIGASTKVVIDTAYTVVFNANASDATGSMDPELMPLGSAQALTANSFARVNWKFDGWNTKADGSGDDYADGASVTGLAGAAGDTVTLYAKWVPADTQTATINGVAVTLVGSQKSIGSLIIKKRSSASAAITGALGNRTLQSDWDVYFSDGTTEDFGTLTLVFLATGKTVQIWEVHSGVLSKGADQAVSNSTASTTVTTLSEFAITSASSGGGTTPGGSKLPSTGDPASPWTIAGLLMVIAAGGACALAARTRSRRS